MRATRAAAPVGSGRARSARRWLCVTFPVTGSASDVSEEVKAAVAAAIAAAAGLDVSEVQVSVIEAADGSVELVLFIAVGDDAAALADVESALDASFGDAAAGVTAALAAGGLVPTASPVVVAPPPPPQRQCYVTVSVKKTDFNPSADDQYIIRTTANGVEIHGRCSPYDGAVVDSRGFFTCAEHVPLPPSADGTYTYETKASAEVRRQPYEGSYVYVEYMVDCEGHCTPPTTPCSSRPSSRMSPGRTARPPHSCRSHCGTTTVPDCICTCGQWMPGS